MQIIGTAKCRDTKKCRLWFDQRGLSYHFVDLNKRALSPGELRSIAAATSWDELLDRNGKTWSKRQLDWKVFDAEEEILQDMGLLRTPVVREGGKVVIGCNPEEWNKNFRRQI